jgi:hypothetical protein
MQTRSQTRRQAFPVTILTIDNVQYFVGKIGTINENNVYDFKTHKLLGRLVGDRIIFKNN